MPLVKRTVHCNQCGYIVRLLAWLPDDQDWLDIRTPELLAQHRATSPACDDAQVKTEEG